MSVCQRNIHNLFAKTTRQLAKSAAKVQPRNVHRLRTSIRRLEAILEELSPELNRNQRKVVRLLARLRRCAGKVRDIDVLVAALRSLRVSDQPGRKTQILSTLADLRIAREEKFLKVFNRVSVRETRERLKRAESDLHLPDNFPGPLALASRNFARLATEHQTLTEDSLHQYRIRGKRVRYLAELAGDDPEAQVFVHHLKSMQDVLGEWHDWLTLAQFVAKLTNSSTNSPLLSALNNITRAKFHEAIHAVAETKKTLAGNSQERKQPSSGSPGRRRGSARALAAAA